MINRVFWIVLDFSFSLSKLQKQQFAWHTNGFNECIVCPAIQPATTIRRSPMPASPTRRLTKTRLFSWRFQLLVWRVLVLSLTSLFVVSFMITAVSAARLYLPSITATKTDSFVGGDGDGKADPGETIQYSVDIHNSGSAATGVTYTDTIDSNTTLVAGSTAASPAAEDDTYPETVIGNVSVNSSTIGYSVVSNDYLGLNPTAAISAYDAASAQGGTITMTTSGAGMGEFTYDPPAGFTGTDTFTYTLSDNTNASSPAANRKATVSITVSGMVWFINNNPAACSLNCDGRLSHPFITLAAFNDINHGIGLQPAANDNIFIYESGTAYTGGITLLAGQKLIGQDSTASLASITGLTPSSSSMTFPAMNTGGPATTIQNAAGDAITIGEGNTIRGLTVGITSGAGITGVSKNALTVGSDVVLTGISGNDLSLSGGNGTVDFGASVTNTAGRAISIQNRTGGTITLTGNISDNGGSGVFLNSNTGATIHFTGALTLSTGTADSFTAINGGTVSSTSSTSTLTSTTGTALKVSNTTIGAGGLTFQSISSTGAPNGIFLYNTGSSGGLTVTGSGAASTGGAIQNSTGSDSAGIIPMAGENAGSGIFLYITGSVSLSWMQLNNHANYAIYGNTVNGFSLAHSVVNGSNGTNATVDEASIAFNGLTGTASISNTTIQGGIEDNFRVRNTSGSLNITFDTVTLGANNISTGNDGINLDASGTATINPTIKSSTFTAAAGDLFQLNLSDFASSDLVIRDSSFSNNHPAIATGGGGVTIGAGNNTGSVNLRFHIYNNSFRDANGHAVLLFKSTDPGTVQGTFENNIIGVAGVNDSGSVSGDGIKIQNAGLGAVTVAVLNNQIYQYNNYGIDLITGGGASAMSGSLDATVTGNIIANPGTGGLPMNGIMLNGGTVVGDTYAICTNIGGAGALANTINGSGANGGTDVRLRQRQSTTVRLPGYGGANNDNTAVQTYLMGRNITGITALAANTVPTGGGFVNGICALPTNPVGMLPTGNRNVAWSQPENAGSGFMKPSDISDTNNREDSGWSELASQSGETFPVTGFGGKPLFDLVKPSPAQSGETINVNIGNLPGGKSVHVVFSVTVDGPLLPPGTTKITNQGTLHSNELSDVLTTNGGTVDCETGAETCTPVDRPDTTVSIVRDDPNPSSASSVSWTATFTAPITSLTSSNFSLANTGLTGPGITSVTPIGTAQPGYTQLTVTASAGTGEGTLGLNMVNDTGLSHDVTNLTYTGPTYTIDHTPAITNVSYGSNTGCLSSSPYDCNTGDTVNILVDFTELVNVTGTPQLALDSGGIATYLSGSGSTSLTFKYTVAASENSSDLDYTGTGALTLNTGTIQDATSNNATLTLSSPGQPGSLGANANVVIDTTAPDTLIDTNPGNPGNSTSATFTFHGSDSGSGVASLECQLDGGGFSACSSGKTYTGLADGSHTFEARAIDTAGNTDPTPASFTWTIDTVVPGVTVEQATGQADPTGVSPVHFTATFSKPINTSTFTGSDVSLSGTANPTTAAISQIAPNDDTTFDIAVSGMTVSGTVVASINSGQVSDLAGNDNTASTSTDNTVDFVYAAPPVIIEGSSVLVTMTKNGSPVPFALTLHATDINADPLTWSIQTAASSGTASVDSGPGNSTSVHYTPLSNYVGADTFVVRVSDGNGGTDDITIHVTILEPTTVSKIDSIADTGDGEVDENEHTSAAVTQLLVVFSNNMNDFEAGDASNYSLVQGDSTTITINSAAYDAPTHTTTLDIHGGTALAEGEYTLTVKGGIHDSLGAGLGSDFVRIFHVDTTGIQVIASGVTTTGGTVIVNAATLNTSFSEIRVTFNEDAANPAGDVPPDDVTAAANYLLVRPGLNTTFDTVDCLTGVGGDDVIVPTGPVTYDNGGGSGPFVATVRINNGTSLENGMYRLFVCGTTSITDLAGNALNGGADSRLTFTILVQSGKGGNPKTGFEPGVITALPSQPAEKAYTDPGNLWFEIPSLGVRASISGVPLVEDGWDLTWLNNQVGWLEGTAYPTWNGNTVLTAHNYTPDGAPGPFARLKDLKYGDTVVIHLGGMKYTYAIRGNFVVDADNTYWLTKHEERDWVTLITCQQFDDKSKTYLYRRVVRAVLTNAESE
jgi:LPXTG-site transpeptidase (sortase) family protein